MRGGYFRKTGIRKGRKSLKAVFKSLAGQTSTIKEDMNSEKYMIVGQ